jgi:two-component system, LytTR family, sensor kinase
MIIERQKIILFHLLFWVLNYAKNFLFWNPTVFQLILDQLFIAIPFYINYFILVPYFFKKKAPVFYVLWLMIFMILFVGIYFTWNTLHPLWFEESQSISVKDGLGATLHVSLLYGGLSTSARLMIDWITNERENRKLMIQKMNSKMAGLKSDINIPFMLQTLSHLQRVSNIQPSSVQEPVISLSNILRYSLYESSVETIPLKREIEVLNDYISLLNQNQKKICLKLEDSVQNPAREIPPNLLVKFFTLWKEEMLPDQEALIKVKIETPEKEVRMMVPIYSALHGFEKSLQETINHYKSRLFSIHYTLEGKQGILIIRNKQ